MNCGLPAARMNACGRHFRSPALRGFRDQALQQGTEDAGVTPLPEAVVDGRPGAGSIGISRRCPPVKVNLAD